MGKKEKIKKRQVRERNRKTKKSNNPDNQSEITNKKWSGYKPQAGNKSKRGVTNSNQDFTNQENGRLSKSRNPNSQQNSAQSIPDNTIYSQTKNISKTH